MDSVDPLNCNLNTKLSKKLAFCMHKRQAPNRHTETTLGVFPKGMMGPLLAVSSLWKGALVQMGLGASQLLKFPATGPKESASAFQ